MDYSELLKTLNSASSFELFRLSTAIDRELQNPKRVIQIKARLNIGQVVRYFDATDNREYEGRIEGMGRTNIKIRCMVNNRRWLVPYYCINLEEEDTQIVTSENRVQPNELSVGQLIGFTDKDGRERSGTVQRINPKTVSLIADDQSHWRVAYEFLFHLIDGKASSKATGSLLIEG